MFEALTDHPIAAHLPVPFHQRSVRGIEYFVSPRLAHTGESSVGRETGAFSIVLEKLSVGAESLRVDQSDFWARVFAAELTRPMEQLGARTALESMRALGDQVIPCGLVHGDLHLANILNHSGRRFLIDWDQFERRSPRFLDAFDLTAALIRHNPRVVLHDWFLDPVKLIVADDARLPLARLLSSESGALLPLQCALMYLLHRASWRCTLHPYVSARDSERFGRAFRWCVDALAFAA